MTLSNSPGALSNGGAEKPIYGHAFFPWEAPVALEPEDAVSVILRADLVEEEYVWTWKSRVLQQGRESEVKAQFTQSTLHATPLSPARLRKRADGYRPQIGEAGAIDCFILSLMDRQAAQRDSRIASRSASPHAS